MHSTKYTHIPRILSCGMGGIFTQHVNCTDTVAAQRICVLIASTSANFMRQIVPLWRTSAHALCTPPQTRAVKLKLHNTHERKRVLDVVVLIALNLHPPSILFFFTFGLSKSSKKERCVFCECSKRTCNAVAMCMPLQSACQPCVNRFATPTPPLVPFSARSHNLPHLRWFRKPHFVHHITYHTLYFSTGALSNRKCCRAPRSKRKSWSSCRR